MSLASMVRGLANHEVAFVVIGGVAGVAHGSARVTRDLDLCFSLEPQNLVHLADLLSGWHAYPRNIEPDLPSIMDAQTLRTVGMFALSTSEGDLDLFARVLGVGDFGRAWADSEEVDAFGVRFHVLGLDALIAAKEATDRPRDRDHLVELRALRALSGSI